MDDQLENNVQLSRRTPIPFRSMKTYTKDINLDEIHRIPIILKYLQDFSEKEIAEILDLNINTLKSRLYKGRQKLKKFLEEGGRANNG